MVNLGKDSVNIEHLGWVNDSNSNMCIYIYKFKYHIIYNICIGFKLIKVV